MATIDLIVGLGNPGAEYEATRHNVGFWLVDTVVAAQGQRFSREPKFRGETAKVVLAGEPVWILKPTTYMNLSGDAVAALAQFYKIAPEKILVVHDELDLSAGTVRLKQGGGHGGHNGLRSINECLSSPNFLRLRLGIGHPGDRSLVTNYVLHRPGADDEREICVAIQSAIDELPRIVSGQIDRVMQVLNAKPKPVADKAANGD